ncbi:restriction endonuclease [Sporomusa sphaeroides DSM 2875]|uniref:restriction endonuclease n=1 Tax=Sporomusa sphaeroides TaxID=47679 RepID=UPI00202F25BC|nr:restriction endonuclease [Sporomusa sphaeroides]MCM0758115.1 restriction endonuclease [Sporomusa sphaeroides DSM 2875]
MYTRTINPIHFEDLEPHRFEDLIRQLAYDFRQWKSIEAIGKCGADNGIDIKAVEISTLSQDDAGDMETIDHVSNEKEWIIQCKREKSINPAKVRKIVKESFQNGQQNTYGFILAAACDFSKKARDEFRIELVKLGIQEFYIWGKSELEDMLFMPKNDHLLFAYFDISLQVKKKSLKTTYRSRIATKRKLIEIIGPINQEAFSPVLLRNAANEQYPEIEDPKSHKDWNYFICLGQTYPDYVAFIEEECFAYLAEDYEHWAAYTDERLESLNQPFHEIWGLDRIHESEREEEIRYKWLSVHENLRGKLRKISFIHIDKILAIDVDGDFFNPGPHIIVDLHNKESFFDWSNVVLSIGSGYSQRYIEPKKETRIDYF